MFNFKFNVKKIICLTFFVFLVPSIYSMKYQREVKNKVAENLAQNFSNAIFIKLSLNLNTDSGINTFAAESINGLTKNQLSTTIEKVALNNLALYNIKDLVDKDELKAFANKLVDDILANLKDKFAIDGELKANKINIVMDEPILNIAHLGDDKNALALIVKDVINDANKPSQTLAKIKRGGSLIIAILGLGVCWVVYSVVYQGAKNPSTLPKILHFLMMYGAPLLAIYCTCKLYQLMPDCIKPTTHVAKIWNSINNGDEKK